VEALEREVRIWSPACSVFWALWGIIQAEEHVGKMVEDKDWMPEFDYLVSAVRAELIQSYAIERLEMFRKEARELGVQMPQPQ
jgi:choline kinase